MIIFISTLQKRRLRHRALKQFLKFTQLTDGSQAVASESVLPPSYTPLIIELLNPTKIYNQNFN